MPNNYAPRLSLSYADLSGVVAAYAEVCDKLIVYEHEADGKVKTTHIHLLIIGSSNKDEALRRLAQKARMDIRMSGNEFWKWAIKKEHKAKFVSDPLSFITYMAKGKLAPKYVKNISPAEVEERRTAWVEPTVLAPEGKYDEYDELKKSLQKEHNYWNMSLDNIRSWTMRWYWSRDGRLPHVGQYKRNAASLYVYAQSYNNNPISPAIEEIKNLWY